jgi:hypothetical protein
MGSFKKKKEIVERGSCCGFLGDLESEESSLFRKK